MSPHHPRCPRWQADWQADDERRHLAHHRLSCDACDSELRSLDEIRSTLCGQAQSLDPVAKQRLRAALGQRLERRRRLQPTAVKIVAALAAVVLLMIAYSASLTKPVLRPPATLTAAPTSSTRRTLAVGTTIRLRGAQLTAVTPAKLRTDPEDLTLVELELGSVMVIASGEDIPTPTLIRTPTSEIALRSGRVKIIAGAAKTTLQSTSGRGWFRVGTERQRPLADGQVTIGVDGAVLVEPRAPAPRRLEPSSETPKTRPGADRAPNVGESSALKSLARRSVAARSVATRRQPVVASDAKPTARSTDQVPTRPQTDRIKARPADLGFTPLTTNTGTTKSAANVGAMNPPPKTDPPSSPEAAPRTPPPPTSPVTDDETAKPTSNVSPTPRTPMIPQTPVIPQTPTPAPQRPSPTTRHKNAVRRRPPPTAIKPPVSRTRRIPAKRAKREAPTGPPQSNAPPRGSVQPRPTSRSLMTTADRLRRQGQRNRAQALYARIIRRGDRLYFEEAVYRRAALLSDMGRLREALATLDTIGSSLTPRFLQPERLALAAHILVQLEQPEQAGRRILKATVASTSELLLTRVRVAAAIGRSQTAMVHTLLAPCLEPTAPRHIRTSATAILTGLELHHD